LRRKLRTAAQPALSAMAPRGPKEFSAMIRIHDEEEWIYQSISSIAEHVEQLVLVDNLSTDRTPALIRQIASEHPLKVAAYSYPHRIARQGLEHRELAASRDGHNSPRLLPNYYNWCLARCDKPYVIKWDCDMIALPEWYVALDAFRASSRQVMCFSGVNIHPTADHVVKNIPPVVDAPPPFLSSIPAADYPEARIFPKRFAAYRSASVFEGLRSPFDQPGFAQVWDEPMYLHVWLRKRQPFANASPNDRQRVLLASVQPGEPLSADAVAALHRWQPPRVEQRQSRGA
jgi:glycosyltransferase involved in cell wall biosynthesis